MPRTGPQLVPLALGLQLLPGCSPLPSQNASGYGAGTDESDSAATEDPDLDSASGTGRDSGKLDDDDSADSTVEGDQSATETGESGPSTTDNPDESDDPDDQEETTTTGDEGGQDTGEIPVPEVCWQRQEGSDKYDRITATAMDEAGNTYVTGFTHGDFIGDTPVDGADMWIGKYAPDGQRIWQTYSKQPSIDEGRGITVGYDGFIYIVSMTGAPGPDSGVFLSSYRDDGTARWHRALPTSVRYLARSLDLTAQGDLVFAGYSTRVDNNDLSELFGQRVPSYRSEGWLHKLPALDGNLYAEASALDSQGNLFIGGWITTEVALGESSGGNDMVVVKITPDGALSDYFQLGSSGHDGIDSLVIDENDRLFFSGITYDSLSGSVHAGRGDAIVGELDQHGDLVWIDQVGTPGPDKFVSVVLGPDNALFVGGSVEGEAVPGAWQGANDSIVGKYQRDGTRLWLLQFGDPGEDHVVDVAVSSEGVITAAGVTTNVREGIGNDFFMSGICESTD